MVQLHLNVCIDIFEIRISRLVSENGFKNLINLTYPPKRQVFRRKGEFTDSLAFSQLQRIVLDMEEKIIYLRK